MKNEIQNMIEENNNRMELFKQFILGNQFCDMANNLLGSCSDCPCHDKITGDCALEKVQEMLEEFDTELYEKKARIISIEMGARRFPDCYNVHG